MENIVADPHSLQGLHIFVSPGPAVSEKSQKFKIIASGTCLFEKERKIYKFDAVQYRMLVVESR